MYGLCFICLSATESKLANRDDLDPGLLEVIDVSTDLDRELGQGNSREV